MRGLAFICAIACDAIAGQAAAQSVDAAQLPPAPVAPAADMMTLAAKTVVDIEIAQALDSKITKPGERFTIRLAAPIIVGGRTLVPAGVSGEGEVVHAAKARWGGKAGELVLAARYLDCGPTRIALGYFKFGAAGENRAATALGASIVVPFAGFLIAGGEMRVPPGTRANAKVRSDIQFTEGAGPACAPPDVSQSAPAGGQ